MKRSALVVIAVLALVAVVGPPSIADSPDDEDATVQVLRTYDADANELPEGIAIDKDGNIYLTMTFIGELRRVDPDGSEHLVATLPTGNGFGPTGLAVDEDGNVYAAVVTFDPATQGVYRVTPEGEAERLPGSEAIGFPNGLAFGDDDELYVTDTNGGAVWRIPDGGSAELWIQDPLLAGDDSAPLPFPVGANGITYDDGTVFVTNTELGSVVTIDVDDDDGTAEDPEVLFQDPALGGADGITIDEEGNLYVAVITQSTIVEIDEDGDDWDVIADGSDGLDFASSLVFGQGHRDDETLYFVNFSTGPFFGGVRTHGPALLSLEVGEEGRPQP
jgi:sugar lactone lactonase YvrE